MKTILLVIVCVFSACLVLLGFVRSHGHVPTSHYVRTDAPAHSMGVASYCPSLPRGTYTWTDVPLVVSATGQPITVRHYRRSGLVANDVPSPELPETAMPYRSEVTLHRSDADAVFYDPIRGALGVGKNYVFFVRRIGDTASYRHIEVPYNSVYVFADPVDAFTRGLAGCSAMVLFNGTTTIFVHALPPDAPEAVNGSYVNTVNAFARLDIAINWAVGQWQCWIAAGTPDDLARWISCAGDRGIRIAHSQYIGESGHSAHWSHRHHILSICPE